MLKKHLIPGLVFCGLLVMAKVFAYKLPTEKVVHKNEPFKLSEKRATTSDFSFAQLSFADESLPIGDEKVKQKMKSTLKNFSFAQLQSSRLHQKALEWFPVIEPILEEFGIPNDFKYVVLVESGLKWGVSPKGAAGYWQFMPGTARHYGLKVNNKVDERYNLYKSTVAAARYIKDLYNLFDSWVLAAAAYNVGDNHMRKQINKQQEDNYFKMRLNRETGSYVYKLISIKEVLENPQRNGYENQHPILAYKAPVKENGFFVE